MKYLVQMITEIEVEAPNVMEASRAAKLVRAIGQGSGARRNRNNREFISYRVSVRSEKRSLPQRIEE